MRKCRIMLLNQECSGSSRVVFYCVLQTPTHICILSTERCVHREVCPRRGVSTERCVHGEVCPRRGVSTERCVHGEVCPRRGVSTERCVHGEVCPQRGILFREHFLASKLSFLKGSPSEVSICSSSFTGCIGPCRQREH